MSPFRLSAQTRRLRLERPFGLESGIRLPEVEVAYRTWGRLSPTADNAILVCHALTGSADADDWWASLFGRGRLLDPERDFIVCSNVLGGCYGTTGPTSPAPDGRPWGRCFPRVTIRDQVRLQMALIDALGIRRLQLVIGGSMGGLQALEWALLDPERVMAVAALAAGGRHSAWCLAWSEAQRLALAADPGYRDGDYDPRDPPRAGLAAARAIAMATYRSPRSLDERFGRRSGHAVFGAASDVPDDYAVNGWLRHHGRSLTERFDANSYRILIDALDTHDLARGRGEYEAVLRAIRQPVLIGSIAERWTLCAERPVGTRATDPERDPAGHRFGARARRVPHRRRPFPRCLAGVQIAATGYASRRRGLQAGLGYDAEVQRQTHTRVPGFRRAFLTWRVH
ncbi:MAG: homoserine O-acetyltransferase [Chromatiales bacterium]|nr:homoserine O-acetyltransferase [Chromatiales bacterium]